MLCERRDGRQRHIGRHRRVRGSQLVHGCFDELISKAHTGQAGLRGRNTPKHGRIGPVDGHGAGMRADDAIERVRDALGERQPHERQRLTVHTGVEQGERRPVVCQTTSQLVDRLDGVHLLQRGHPLQQTGGRIPVEAPQLDQGRGHQHLQSGLHQQIQSRCRSIVVAGGHVDGSGPQLDQEPDTPGGGTQLVEDGISTRANRPLRIGQQLEALPGRCSDLGGGTAQHAEGHTLRIVGECRLGQCPQQVGPSGWHVLGPQGDQLGGKPSATRQLGGVGQPLEHPIETAQVTA